MVAGKIGGRERSSSSGQYGFSTAEGSSGHRVLLADQLRIRPAKPDSRTVPAAVYAGESGTDDHYGVLGVYCTLGLHAVALRSYGASTAQFSHPTVSLRNQTYMPSDIARRKLRYDWAFQRVLLAASSSPSRRATSLRQHSRSF